MRKRLISMAVIMVTMLLCCGNAFAQEHEITPYASATITGGLSSLGSGEYQIWGRIQGAREQLSIRIELRTTSGGYIDGASNSGTGPSVSTSETVRLTAGTYHLYIYGTTPTHTPSQVLVVRA